MIKIEWDHGSICATFHSFYWNFAFTPIQEEATSPPGAFAASAAACSLILDELRDMALAAATAFCCWVLLAAWRGRLGCSLCFFFFSFDFTKHITAATPAAPAKTRALTIDKLPN
eukprot:1017684-Pelagomonas_calceolata.AAC.1